MAEQSVQVDRNTFDCSICLDLLTEPVTIPCGHSYCMNCIVGHWNGGVYSCPQCRKTFTPRPVLKKNIILVAAVEQLRNNRHEAAAVVAAAADPHYAGPEDVPCDFCSERQRKAIKFCLVCQNANCEEHLEPHYEDFYLENHILVEPVKNLQQNCSSAEVLQSLLWPEVELYTECILLSEPEPKTRADFLNYLREITLDPNTAHPQLLLSEGNRKGIRKESMAALSFIPRPVLKKNTMLAALVKQLKKTGFQAAPADHCYAGPEDVTSDSCSGRNPEPEPELVSQHLEPEPKSRIGFLKYLCEIILDPNTAHNETFLLEENRKVTRVRSQSYSSHPDRFIHCHQVLSKESLTGHCYWEVEWSGTVYVAVAYRISTERGGGVTVDLNVQISFGHWCVPLMAMNFITTAKIELPCWVLISPESDFLTRICFGVDQKKKKR
ncbi:hypothetical protein CCH79_00009769 [Gambusia affinis]|uniref:RING-type domain-containing protein n=1 Tax=Gambusia affinis TaxID=33528 RepID=A0A315W346_GAMAF|nr:hypothetical protein CCH79_00009769 [Gambusia affinis]